MHKRQHKKVFGTQNQQIKKNLNKLKNEHTHPHNTHRTPPAQTHVKQLKNMENAGKE